MTARLGRRRVMIVALVATYACAPDAPVGWGGLIEGLACEDEVRRTLSEWGAGEEVLRAAPAPGYGARYRIATSVRGEWVQLDVAPDATGVVALVGAERVSTRTFDARCAPTEHLSEHLSSREALPGARTFTDDDLRAALDGTASAATVVYIWSPHMSLSVDGYGEVSAACDQLGLALVTVLFPGADTDFAEGEAARVGIPADGLRESASIELIFRDAQVHAPAILVFDGTRTSPVLPGYRDAEGYRRFIEDFLSSGAGSSGRE